MATDSQRSAETKAKIFISYSRKDIDLADRIEAELSARGFVPLVDRTAIHAFEDWWKRIERLILEADTVVALLTPDFIESEICAREIGFAQALHKRFAPVLCKPVDPQRVTEALARLNFLAFDSGSDDAMERLSTALLTDIGWIRKQTEFGQAAQRWFDAGRPGPRGLLLRSPVLEEAEAWIAARPSDAPAPNDVTRAFIIESRRAANKRRRVLVSTLAAGLVGAVALAGNALWQWRLAVEQRTFADQQRNEALRQRQLADASASEAKSERDRALITQSRFLSDLARQKARTGDHATAALLSVEALPDRTRSDRPHVPEAEAALFDATLHITEASVLPFPYSYGGCSGGEGAVLIDKRGLVFHAWATSPESRTEPLQGLEGEIDAVRFSKNCAVAMTAHRSGTVALWDVTTRKKISVLAGKIASVDDATFSPEGSRLLTYSRSQEGTPADQYREVIRVWQVNTGAKIAEREFDFDGGGSVTPHFPHSNVIFIDTQAARRDMERELWTLHQGEIWSPSTEDADFEISREGDKVITRNGNRAHIWETSGRKALAVLRGHTSALLAAHFSPDGQRVVTTSSDNTARIWDVRSGKTQFVLSGNGEELSGADFSPDGKLLITWGGRGSKARIWNTDNGKLVATLEADDPIRRAQFSPRGRFVLAFGEAPTLYDASSGKRLQSLVSGSGDSHVFTFSSDERLVFGQSHDTMRVWTIEARRHLFSINHPSNILGAGFSPDSRVAFVHMPDGSVRFWDSTSGMPVRHVRPPGELFAVAFRSGAMHGIVRSAGHAGYQVIDLDRGTAPVALQDAAELSAPKFAISADAQMIAAHQRGPKVWLWDGMTGQLRRTLTVPREGVASIAFSPDGRWLLAGAEDGGTPPDWETDPVTSIWNVHTGELMLTIPSIDVSFVAPDTLATPYALWDINAGRRKETSTSLGLHPAAMSPDLRRAAGMSDAGFQMIDVARNEPVALIRDRTRKGAAIFQYSGDGRRVLFGDHTGVYREDSFVRMWAVYPTTQELVDAAKQRMPRCLSSEERRRAFLDAEPPAWCIELRKFPYHTEDWKLWLELKPGNPRIPTPASPNWKTWNAEHRGKQSAPAGN